MSFTDCERRHLGRLLSVFPRLVADIDLHGVNGNATRIRDALSDLTKDALVSHLVSSFSVSPEACRHTTGGKRPSRSPYGQKSVYDLPVVPMSQDEPISESEDEDDSEGSSDEAGDREEGVRPTVGGKCPRKRVGGKCLGGKRPAGKRPVSKRPMKRAKKSPQGRAPLIMSPEIERSLERAMDLHLEEGKTENEPPRASEPDPQPQPQPQPQPEPKEKSELPLEPDDLADLERFNPSNAGLMSRIDEMDREMENLYANATDEYTRAEYEERITYEERFSNCLLI